MTAVMVVAMVIGYTIDSNSHGVGVLGGDNVDDGDDDDVDVTIMVFMKVVVVVIMLMMLTVLLLL